jgi:DNA-directed RNA polymerase subunit M/transcription elongation factor TFIIS
LSAGARTVGRMTNQVQITAEHEVLDEPCPRCGSTAVRAVVYAASVEMVAEVTDAAADPFAGDTPLFDCRECGFEWGEIIRDLMR